MSRIVAFWLLLIAIKLLCFATPTMLLAGQKGTLVWKLVRLVLSSHHTGDGAPTKPAKQAGGK